jgi:ABC-type siderophore export system fused ATPase/permease subunit
MFENLAPTIPWKHNYHSIIIFIIILLLDFSTALLAVFSIHNFQFNGISFSAVSSYEDDAIDSLLISVCRIIALIVLSYLTVRYAAPNYSAAQKLKLSYGKKSTSINSNGKIPHNSIHSSYNKFNSYDEKTEPLLSDKKNLSDSSTVDINQEDLDPEKLSEAEKHEINRIALYRRNWLQAAVFIMLTGMQMNQGIKTVSFSFGINHGNPVLQAVLLGLAIVYINVEQHFLFLILDKLTRPEGHLLLKLHPHFLYWDQTTYWHWCDLCRDRVRGSWRCSRCDFDACISCFRRGDKSRGEGILRSDQGVKDEKEMSNSTYIVRAVKLAKPHWKFIICAFVCLLVSTTASLLLPNYQGQILDSVIQSDKSQFKRDIYLYLFVSIATGLFGAVRSLCFSVVGTNIAMDVRDSLFSNVIIQDITYFDQVLSGELTSRLSNDVSAMTSPITTVLSSFLNNALLLFGGIIFCFYTSWRLSVLAVTSIYPIIQITRAYAKYSKRLNRQIWASLGDSSSVATQAINNIRTVRAFGTEDYEIEKYTQATKSARVNGIKDAYANSLAYALTNYLDLGTSVLILWYGADVAMSHGQMTSDSLGDPLTVGKLITFQLYWNLMNSAYSALVSLLNSFTRAGGAAQRVFSLIDNLPDIVQLPPSSTNEDIQALKGQIDIDNIDFHYQMRPDKQVIQNLSLHIPAGTVCALVGKSGGGKCWAPGSEIMLYSGEFKRVEDMVAGDLLMGKEQHYRFSGC